MDGDAICPASEGEERGGITRITLHKCLMGKHVVSDNMYLNVSVF